MNIDNPSSQTESTENIEVIMSKVEDIDKKGLAYTVISRNGRENQQNLEKTLKEGLTTMTGETFFNIVGRSRDLVARESEVSKSEISRSWWLRDLSNGLVLLFDIDSLKEVNSFSTSRSSLGKGEFSSDLYFEQKREILELTDGEEFIILDKTSPRFEKLRNDNLVNEEGQLNSHSEVGFLMNDTVEISQFKGIIVKGIVNIEFIIDQMKKNNCLLPIYNENGDLLWPIQMGHGEIKKIIQVRKTDLLDVSGAESKAEELNLEWGPDLGSADWIEAQEKINELNRSLKEGEKQWRLPTADELMKEYNKTNEPLENPSQGQTHKTYETAVGFRRACYWSSTLVPGNDEEVYTVSMGRGYKNPDWKVNAMPNWVRPVR